MLTPTACAMVSKKQEFPGYEPRVAQAMGLANATSPIGGSHMRGDPAYFELFGIPKPMDPLEWKGKARSTQAFRITLQSLTQQVCAYFSRFVILWRRIWKLPPQAYLSI